MLKQTIKLNDNTKDIYTYTNEMINNMEYILDEIAKYNPHQVFVLSYYNITNNYNDIFTYLNYKLQKITNNHNYTYLELNKKLKNNPEILEKSNNFSLNNEGYSIINQIIVENSKKYWYNIKRIYYYDLFLSWRKEKLWRKIYIQIMLKQL